MNDRMRDAAVLVGAGLFGTLLLAPLWIAFGVWLGRAGEPAVLAWFPPIGSLLGAVCCAARPLRRWLQLAAGLPFAAAGAALAVSALGASGLFAAAAGALLYFGWVQGVTVSDRIGDTKWQWLGLILYFAAAIVYSQAEMFAGAVPLLTWLGAASLVIALFVANGLFLNAAAYSNRRDAVPGVLRRHNRLMIGGVLALIVLLTVLFGNAFGKLLIAVIRALLSLLPRGTEEAAPPDSPEPEIAITPFPPPEEGGVRTMILDFIFYALGTIVIVALLYLVGRWLYKNGGETIRYWMDRLLSFLARQRRPAAEEAGDTDEETDVFSWETVAKRFQGTWLGRLLMRNRDVKWEDLGTNRERVRWLYRRWLLEAVESGYEPRRAMTPRETAEDVRAWRSERAAKGSRLFGRGDGAAGGSGGAGGAGDGTGGEALADLYDRVRYGAADVSDADVRRARAAAGLKPDE